jgi:hypothetical protein
MDPYPDYAQSEEDYNWEDRLAANPLVVHVAQQPVTEQQE